MNKNIIISLLVVVALFMFTGCEKKESSEKKDSKENKNEHTCVKTNIKKTDSLSGYTYVEDITRTAKLDDDGKLTYYYVLEKFKYENKEACEDSCDATKSWNDEINAKNYTGGRRITTCKCDSNIYTVEYVYDDIENLDPILRSDISELEKDNTFKLNDWLNKFKKISFKCE